MTDQELFLELVKLYRNNYPCVEGETRVVYLASKAFSEFCLARGSTIDKSNKDMIDRLVAEINTQVPEYWDENEPEPF